MRIVALLLVLSVTTAGCLVLFQNADADPVDLQASGEPTAVTSPLRVHLTDGSVVLFPNGAAVGADSVAGGGGRLLPFPDGPERAVSAVALDRVVGAEVYSTDFEPVTSLIASAGASVVAAYAAAGAAVLIFGSCPTVYSATEADTLALEAELFSNSIAPLFEMRDRDVLRHAARQPDGAVRLEIRNEALETHYLNHLALEAVAHAPGARAVPADDGRAHVLSDEAAPLEARDRTGRDVLPPLLALDDVAYETAREVTASVREGDLTDTVTLTFPRPDADSAAVALRFRSSLLMTVVLYEHMLAGQGPGALDWIGQDMASIGSVAQFGEYYLRRLGLRVEVEDGGVFREVARLAEAGPIAWAERAVVVPVPEGDVLRVRLRFLADGWRIDRATLARVETVPTEPVPLVRAVLGDGSDARAPLAEPDRSYLEQGPGRLFQADFSPPAPAPGQAQTLFVSAQGYYSEWMRPDWLRRPAGPRFQPTDATLVDAIASWRALRETYETHFEKGKLPVR